MAVVVKSAFFCTFAPVQMPWGLQAGSLTERRLPVRLIELLPGVGVVCTAGIVDAAHLSSEICSPRTPCHCRQWSLSKR